MTLPRKDFDSWESLFLGSSPAYTTYAFWQYMGAIAFPIAMICESALRVKSRRPDMFASIWPVFTFLAALFLFLAWRELKAVRGLRARLTAAKNSPEYPSLLSSGRAKGVTFVRVAFIYGGIIILLEMVATLLTRSGLAH